MFEDQTQNYDLEIPYLVHDTPFLLPHCRGPGRASPLAGKWNGPKGPVSRLPKNLTPFSAIRASLESRPAQRAENGGRVLGRGAASLPFHPPPPYDTPFLLCFMSTFQFVRLEYSSWYR